MARYATVSEADSYLGFSTEWGNANTAAKERALDLATLYLDGKYDWPGYIVDDTQDLDWPRLDAYDDNGRHLTGVPVAVKNACMELANISLGVDLMPSRSYSVKAESTKVGPIEEEREYTSQSPSFPLIDAILDGIGRRGGYHIELLRS